MKVLGISAYYHDSAAALVVDGEIKAAVQEERFTRNKHDSAFPARAIEACLAIGKLASIGELDAVVFYEKPFTKFDRILETFLAHAPRGFRQFQHAMPLWIKQKLFLKRELLLRLRQLHSSFPEEKLLFSEHHLSHAGSAFFPSPFHEAAILTMDGVGEWTTSSVSVGTGAKITRLAEQNFPHSAGLLYSAFTAYAGFKVNSGEYKLMGLAPYGTARYGKQILDNLLDLKSDGSLRLNLDYFDFATDLRMTNERFHKLFGASPRLPESPITQETMDLAASIQEVIAEIVLRTARWAHKETGLANLCMAGGVALNCVANGGLLKKAPFKKIWIQPAAGDAGGALGAALAVAYIHFAEVRSLRLASADDGMHGSYLGPEYSQSQIDETLEREGLVFHRLSETELLERTAQAITDGRAVGWFQGRMEFGPRSLGARSILADARSASMQSVLNLKVKKRESFRPFAPAVLAEDASSWFDLEVDSPYMSFVAKVRDEHLLESGLSNPDLFGIERLNLQRSVIPAITHIDNSARVQTVHEKTNPRFHRLLTVCKKAYGCSVMVNTSFNVRGEPIVESPLDAIRCFVGADLDALAIGESWVERSEQSAAVLKNKQGRDFTLD